MPLWIEILRSKLPANDDRPSIAIELKKLEIRMNVVSRWITDDVLPPARVVTKLAKHYKVPKNAPEKLKQAILNKETLTNRILGAMAGVSFTSLTDWLRYETKPHLKNLIKLSEWLNVPVAALLLENVKSINDPAVRIVRLLEKLTPDQQQQIADQMETMIEQNGQEPPRF